MSPINEKAISNAAASLEMEGFVILPEYKKLCKKTVEQRNYNGGIYRHS